MTITVDDPEACRMAQTIANETGETMSSVITEALRERYERSRKRDPEAIAAGIRAIVALVKPEFKGPYIDHAELLYDEHGLPK